ncbi:flagellin [Roseibium aggregatum]|uniref:Flagellin n=1 Tax=Roseibium aggregatum TaxID=187304 RepID=A0A926S9Y5_9HYPH|nr:flagellin [Roseibium aggregatum]MBD1547824.1 flagellin [Roseibium aggregatum]
MASNVTLSAAVRSNLNALQATSNLLSSVQEKLSTGKKVNSALDNPNSFFTAKGLENRANDLSSLLDDQGQAVQTLKAADKGITSISDLVDAAKAKANQALQSSSQKERKQFATEYNQLLTQIEDIAKDSSYKGKNLLGGTGNDLKVTFNEKNTSSLSISSVDYTDTTSSVGLNLSDLASGVAGTATLQIYGASSTTALSSTNTLTTAQQFSVGDVVKLTDSTGTELGSLTVDANTKVSDFTNFVNNTSGTSGSLTGTTFTLTADYEVSLSSSTSGFTTTSTTHASTNGFSTDAKIESQLSKLQTAQNTLRAQASTFGTNLSIVQNRQDFTKNLINTLQEGAGKLTLADTNEEGANVLALQTQQSLASTSLSLAAQADKNVLRLF